MFYKIIQCKYCITIIKHGATNYNKEVNKLAKIKLVDTKEKFSLEIDGTEIPYVATYAITKTVSGFLTMQVTLGVNEVEEIVIENDNTQVERKRVKKSKR